MSDEKKKNVGNKINQMGEKEVYEKLAKLKETGGHESCRYRLHLVGRLEELASQKR